MVRVRHATLAFVSVALASCEALVGITNRELAPSDAGASDSSAGGEQGGEDVANSFDQANDADAADGSTSASDAADARRGDGSAIDGGVGVDADAAAEAAADGTPDTGPTSSDGNGGDGTSAGDGANDASQPMDPDVPCSAQPSYIYCNDFDPPGITSLGATWSWDIGPPDASAGYRFAFDTNVFVSSPNSLVAVTPQITSGIGLLQLGKDVGALSAGFRFAFDLRIDMTALAGAPQFAPAQLLFMRATGRVEINFIIGPGATAELQSYVPVADGGPDAGSAQGNLPYTPQSLMAWHRVVIAYDSIAGSVILYLDGQSQGSIPVGGGAPGDTQIVVGDVYVEPNGTVPVATEMDNVVISDWVGH